MAQANAEINLLTQQLTNGGTVTEQPVNAVITPSTTPVPAIAVAEPVAPIEPVVPVAPVEPVDSVAPVTLPASTSPPMVAALPNVSIPPKPQEAIILEAEIKKMKKQLASIK